MATRRHLGPGLVLAMAGVLIAGASLAPAPAGAAEPIHGDLRCVVGPASMSFVPSLVIIDSPNPAKGRTGMTAAITECRGSAPASPAPGDIHHGSVTLKGKFKPNYCEDLTTQPGHMSTGLSGTQRLKVTWYDVNGERVGRNSYGQRGIGMTYDFPAYPFPTEPIATVAFTSTLRPTAKAFGGEPISLRLPTDLSEFGHQCAAGPVASIPFLAGEITIGTPS